MISNSATTATGATSRWEKGQQMVGGGAQKSRFPRTKSGSILARASFLASQDRGKSLTLSRRNYTKVSKNHSSSKSTENWQWKRYTYARRRSTGTGAWSFPVMHWSTSTTRSGRISAAQTDSSQTRRPASRWVQQRTLRTLILMTRTKSHHTWGFLEVHNSLSRVGQNMRLSSVKVLERRRHRSSRTTSSGYLAQRKARQRGRWKHRSKRKRLSWRTMNSVLVSALLTALSWRDSSHISEASCSETRERQEQQQTEVRAPDCPILTLHGVEQ